MGRKNETTPNDTLMTPRFPEVSFGVVSPRRGNDPTTKRHLAAKRSKYGAKRAVRLDGEKFDSRGEMRWLAGLELLERQGKISDLRRQVTLDLEFDGRPVRSLRSGRALRCRPDAMFLENGRVVVADYKGAPITPESLLKFALLAHMHPDWEIRLEGPGAPKPVKRKPKGRAR